MFCIVSPSPYPPVKKHEFVSARSLEGAVLSSNPRATALREDVGFLSYRPSHSRVCTPSGPLKKKKLKILNGLLVILFVFLYFPYFIQEQGRSP